MISIEIDKNTIHSCIDLIKKDIENYHYQVGLNVNHAKQKLFQYLLSLTPVRTGYLKSRWRNNPIRYAQKFHRREWIGVISNDTYYLLFVNDGHFTTKGTYVNGQYFIERALKLLQRDLDEMVFL